MDLLFGVHFLWLFHCIISLLNCSHFPVDQWFTNLTLYQILVQVSNKSRSICIVHQKQLSFHINPGIIALLPLDSVLGSLSRCDGIWESAHVEVENLNWHMIVNWIGFCSVLCRYLHRFFRNWLINIQNYGFFSSCTPNPYTLQLLWLDGIYSGILGKAWSI